MSLDSRKMQILRAIIDDYIVTATPVGSRTISKHSGLGLSSATIRNEMYDLKELGLLEQPHTSAGSMPSESAYRLYVNSIMDHVDLTGEEIKYIEEHFSKRINGVEDIVKQTAVVLSNMTNYLSMVMSPQLHEVTIVRIQLIPITDEKALLVVVTTTGLYKDSIVKIPSGIDPRYIDKLSEMLTNRFYGCKIKDVSENLIFDLFSEIGARKEHFSLASEINAGVQTAASSKNGEVELRGANNLLHYPEYSGNIAKTRDLFSAIEQRDVIYSILDSAIDVELAVKIGSENSDPNLKDCSVVTATYKLDNNPVGSFGVIGPTRMNYARVVAVVDYLGKIISKALTDLYGE